MDIEFGDANALDTQGTGWFVGFSPWVQTPDRGTHSLRYMREATASRGLCVKWMRHPAGDPRGAAKPVSVGRTLSIFASDSGRFCIDFSERIDFPAGHTESFVLDRPGLFCVWGPGLFHRYAVEADCTILTVRWTPDED
jgi:hypothetical protein